MNTPKTHCRRGHAYTPANTIPRADGARECRTCQVERQARYNEQFRSSGNGHRVCKRVGDPR